ncbi:MAG: DNA polymerase I [Terriglobales bacterium]
MAPPNQKRLFLIDTYSFIFRAYHAMARQRPMSTKTGIPTAATYVFVNMLKKLRADFSPEYIAAIFESGPTFRDEQAATRKAIQKFDIKSQSFTEVAYAGYKANRAEMPPDLRQQVPFIKRALAAYRIPMLESTGFEADDVIGTLAHKAAKESFEVFVVSSDKDMLQLVGGKVCVLNPPKDNLICDAAKVDEILGVKPEQVVDVMALRGDSVDNIPGAPGIGDKGSVELIQRFGSLDSLLAHASEVEKKSYRESLLNNKEQILWSKQLVTIDCNVPIEFEPEAMRAQEPQGQELRELFTELEFTTLLKDISPSVVLADTDYRAANSADDIKKLLKGIPKGGALAIAVEFAAAATVSESEADELEAESGTLPLIPPALAAGTVVPAGKIAISGKAGEALTIELDGGAINDALAAALAEPKLPKAFHDYKAALHAFVPRGIELRGARDETSLYSYLLNSTFSNHALPEIGLRQFNLKLSGEVAESADVTGRAAAMLRKEVDDAGLLPVYEMIDLPLVPVLASMERAGVKIDQKQLGVLSKRLDGECSSKAKLIHQLAGQEFNINSPKQLGDVLFNKMNLPKPVKYGKGKTISTAVDVLEELAAEHEIAKRVLEYRQVSKLKSTYVDALPMLLNPETARLHTTFNQTGTATGRLSSTNPNLQNIPIRTEQGREIRAAFIAEEGHVLLAADYSQIELRLLAHFSGDELLVEAFRRGDDIHALTASQVFGVPPMMLDAEHRRRAKAVNFGIVYGISPFGLAAQLDIEQKEAKQFIEAYFTKYKGVRAWLDSVLEQARKESKVSTLFGRTRPIPDINSKNANMRGFAERTATNTPLQGTAADLIKLAMIRLDEELRTRKLKSRMTLQVHDELVFEVPLDEVETMRDLVRDKMENVYELKVPIVADIGVGKNWRDMD